MKRFFLFIYLFSTTTTIYNSSPHRPRSDREFDQLSRELYLAQQQADLNLKRKEIEQFNKDQDQREKENKLNGNIQLALYEGNIEQAKKFARDLAIIDPAAGMKAIKLIDKKELSRQWQTFLDEGNQNEALKILKKTVRKFPEDQASKNEYIKIIHQKSLEHLNRNEKPQALKYLSELQSMGVRSEDINQFIQDLQQEVQSEKNYPTINPEEKLKRIKKREEQWKTFKKKTPSEKTSNFWNKLTGKASSISNPIAQYRKDKNEKRKALLQQLTPFEKQLAQHFYENPWHKDMLHNLTKDALPNNHVRKAVKHAPLCRPEYTFEECIIDHYDEIENIIQTTYGMIPSKETIAYLTLGTLHYLYTGELINSMIANPVAKKVVNLVAESIVRNDIIGEPLAKTSQHFAAKDGINPEAIQYQVEKSKSKIENFLGIEELSPEQQNKIHLIIDELKNPQKYPVKSRGLLIDGPAGLGKTHLMECIAGEAGVKVIRASGARLINKYMGTGPQSVQDLFDLAAQHASENNPVIIIMDEFDSVGKRGDDGAAGANAESRRTINAMLDKLTDPKYNHIHIFGATNDRSAIDPALQRPGRIDKHFTLTYPKPKTRKELIVQQIKKHGIKIPIGVDFTSAAQQLDKKTPAEINGAVDEQINLWKLRQHECSSDEPFNFDTFLASFNKKSNFDTNAKSWEKSQPTGYYGVDGAYYPTNE